MPVETTPTVMKFQCQSFSDLTPLQLWKILKLRQEVFVLEQECLFPEIDDKDPSALHIYTTDHDAEPNGPLQAYCRLLAPGLRFEEPCISRVVVAASRRGTGLGQELMHFAIAQIHQRFGNGPIRISAQQHLGPFYARVGFEPCSQPYLEDDIWHLDMLRRSNSV